MAVLATDLFNRANGGLGANWTTVTSSEPPQIRSNVVEDNQLGFGDGVAFYNAATWPNDQYSQIVVLAAAGNFDSYVGPCVRMSGATETYYRVAVSTLGGASAQWSIERILAGAYTQLASGTATIVSGDTLYLSAVGTALTFKVNGATIGSTTDALIASGSAGILVSSSVSLSQGQLDNFEGGDFSAAAAQVSYQRQLVSWPDEPRLHPHNARQSKIAPLIPEPSPFSPGGRAGAIYPAILLAHQDAIAQIELVASGVVAPDPSDQPPRQFALAPQTLTQIGARWVQDWGAQTAPKSASWNIPPTLVELPHVPQPAAILLAWVPQFVAPPRPVAMAALVPAILVELPHVALPSSLWTAWVPPFVAPPRPVTIAVLTIVYGSAPPPRSPLATQNLIDIAATWVQTWGTQHGHVSTEGAPVTFRPAWAGNSNRGVGGVLA